MDVQVKNSLAALLAGVDDGTPTLQVFLARHMGSLEQKMTQQFRITIRGCRQALDRLLGNNENMHRSQRADVPKSQTAAVFVHNLSGNLAADDFAKDGLWHWATMQSGSSSSYMRASVTGINGCAC